MKTKKIYTRVNDETLMEKTIKAGVLQNLILSSLLYNLYTSDIPKNNNTELAFYSDVTAIPTSSLANQKL